MQRQRGFTLIELLFALLILTVIITTSLAVFVERTRRLAQASDIMLVWQVLANEAEIVRRVHYANLDSVTGFTTDLTLLRPLKGRQTEVHVGTISPGIRRVTLTIRWDYGEREATLFVYRVDTGGGTLW